MEADKTPNCRMHEELISYLYNEASPEEIGRVEHHLTECAACKGELAAFRQVRGLLQQWQVDDLPFVRIATASEDRPRQSWLAALKNLLAVTPAWAKAFGAVATAMLVLAVVGTEVSVGRDGVSIKAAVFRWNDASQTDSGSAASRDEARDEARLDEIRDELKSVVSSLIAENERQQREEMKAQLVSLESQLQTAHEANLAKLAARIQEQRARLKSLERDIDRSESGALNDILFGEDTSVQPSRRTSERGGD